MRVLLPEDAEAILQFERARIQDPMDEWHARWRQESLHHYLGLGWSFGKFSADGDHLEGYFLAQALLFFRGMTQTLWVEHVSFQNESVGRELISTAYKWGRDKHMQHVLLPGSTDPRLLPDSKNRSINEPLIEIATTRMVNP